jgi:ribosomal protein L11 methyltransferase
VHEGNEVHKGSEGMIRLALRVARADAETVLAELLTLAPAGVEERELGEGVVEYAVYGAPGELPQLPDLHAAAGSALVEVSTSELPDDWHERWKEFHRPVFINAPDGTPSLCVRPPWQPRAGGEAEAGAPAGSSGHAGVREIVLDPGQAFGTGAHHTTRLCLQLLLALAVHDPVRGPAIDLGCGSGVLAIAAAQLGFAPVLALDHEQASVQAAQVNARANGVALDVRPFDLRRQALPSQPTLLLANLVSSLLLQLAASLDEVPAHLLASGLLRGEADEVAAAFHARLGLIERERSHSGEWSALWLTAPSTTR